MNHDPVRSASIQSILLAINLRRGHFDDLIGVGGLIHDHQKISRDSLSCVEPGHGYGRVYEIFRGRPTDHRERHGPYVYNARKQRYLDGISGIWNVAAGLGRSELVDAAARQMTELAFTGCWSMAHPRAIELAAKLVEITGGHYQQVMFGSNGSDAVEATLKIARQYFRQSPDPADAGAIRFSRCAIRTMAFRMAA